MPTHYEIRVAGAIGPAAREALHHLTIEVIPASASQGTTTVVSGRMDIDRLHETLDRIRAFGLELVEIRHLPAHDATSS